MALNHGPNNSNEMWAHTMADMICDFVPATRKGVDNKTEYENGNGPYRIWIIMLEEKNWWNSVRSMKWNFYSLKAIWLSTMLEDWVTVNTK